MYKFYLCIRLQEEKQKDLHYKKKKQQDLEIQFVTLSNFFFFMQSIAAISSTIKVYASGSGESV